MAATYTIEAKMQVISGSTSFPSCAAAAIAFWFGPTHQKNILQMSVNEVFVLSAENTKAQSVAFDTTDEFHIYQLVIDTAAKTFQVYIDGTPKLTGSTDTDPAASPDYVIFGEQSIYTHGESNWAYVTHNASSCD